MPNSSSLDRYNQLRVYLSTISDFTPLRWFLIYCTISFTSFIELSTLPEQRNPVFKNNKLLLLILFIINAHLRPSHPSLLINGFQARQTSGESVISHRQAILYHFPHCCTSTLSSTVQMEFFQSFEFLFQILRRINFGGVTKFDECFKIYLYSTV